MMDGEASPMRAQWRAEEQGDKQRKDAGKARLDLIPRRPLLDVSECLEIGAKKYTPHGWRDGMAWSRCAAPMLRHALAWLDGEDRDPVDGQKHLAAVIVNAMFLLEYEHTHPELDDRYKPPTEPTTYTIPIKVATPTFPCAGCPTPNECMREVDCIFFSKDVT